MAKEKVILAYSGGLDTTAIIPWLKETYDYEVICACIDVGQESELDGLDERAKYSGAEKLYIVDVIDEFCVSPKAQGRGIGSEMLRHIMNEMRAKGFVSVVLQTTKGFPSERFYLKNGFVQSPDMITMYHMLNGA